VLEFYDAGTISSSGACMADSGGVALEVLDLSQDNPLRTFRWSSRCSCCSTPLARLIRKALRKAEGCRG